MTRLGLMIYANGVLAGNNGGGEGFGIILHDHRNVDGSGIWAVTLVSLYATEGNMNNSCLFVK